MIYRRMFGVPSWNVRSPFGELELMRQQVDNFLSRVSEGGMPSLHAGVFPSINLTEDKDHYYIRAELPGISSEELDIQATVNNLSISGERQIATEKDNVRYHRKEREAGKFSRAISLPGDIDPDGVSASLNNGILKVSVPKAEKAKPKQITIN
ncbi:MAG: Hsp20/alpha crystallin family protein [Deltaproteobacteria bacterium]|nr:MAG: Hsp20/alpha crystallin family protein [Deltaproteobacteria bacterium]